MRYLAAESVGLGDRQDVEDKGGEELRVTESQGSGFIKPGVWWCYDLRYKTLEETPRHGAWKNCFFFVHIESESPVSHWNRTIQSR